MGALKYSGHNYHFEINRFCVAISRVLNFNVRIFYVLYPFSKYFENIFKIYKFHYLLHKDRNCKIYVFEGTFIKTIIPVVSYTKEDTIRFCYLVGTRLLIRFSFRSVRCFSWFIGELLSSLLARYRFFPLFFTGLFVYDRIRVCPVCYPLQPTNQRGARSLVTFILDAQPSPRALLFLLSSLSLSLFCSLFAILSIASGTSHRVTDPRHLLSAVNCRALEPGLLTFWKFVVSKKQTTNERMNERGPLARRMDCPEFVRSSSHSSAGIIELFVSIYLFFRLLQILRYP